MCDLHFKFEEDRTKLRSLSRATGTSDGQTDRDRKTDRQILKWFYICPIPWIALDRQ